MTAEERLGSAESSWLGARRIVRDCATPNKLGYAIILARPALCWTDIGTMAQTTRNPELARAISRDNERAALSGQRAWG